MGSEMCIRDRIYCVCCCAPFVGHIPPMSLQNPKFPSKLNRTEMADEAELFCTSASKTVVFARLLVSVNDLHRGLSSSVFRVEQITQNPVVATPYRFDPGHRHQYPVLSDGVFFFAKQAFRSRTAWRRFLPLKFRLGNTGQHVSVF